jgi:RNA binding exosome subunit
MKNQFANDREFMLALLAYNGTYLEHASEELKADKEVIMAALQSGYSLPYEHVSDTLKTDKDFLLEIVSLDAFCLEFFSEELKQDEQIVLAAAKHFGDAALEFGAEKFKTNKNIITEAVKSSGKALSFLAENEKNDKNLVITAVKHHGYALQYASEELRNDKDVVITAVGHNGNALQYASEELQNDKDVVITAVGHNGNALQYASEELQNDKDVAMAALINSTEAFKYISERLQSDKEFILHAIGQKDVDAFDDDLDSYISDNIPEKLKSEKDFVLQMVSVNGMALGCVADELKVDKEVVTLAVKNNGKAYAHFEWEDETFYDKEIILAAASKGGTPSVIPIFTLDEEFFDKIFNYLPSIAYESRISAERCVESGQTWKNKIGQSWADVKKPKRQITGDREFALRGVKKGLVLDVFLCREAGIVFDKEIILYQLKNCLDKKEATLSIINHAPEEFKADKEIALEAVKNTRYVLGKPFLSDELILSDKEIIIEGMKHSPDALYYASDNLKNDRELLLSALLNKDKINDTYRFDEIFDELF